MNLLLKSSSCKLKSAIAITGSKSETNRLLLLQALYPGIVIENSSNSDDSEVMTKALRQHDTIIDVHHAGTAMRFLTAYFAIQENKEVIITGSDRMKQRPIQILVDALQQLGATITYEENEGFPPLKITGKKLTQNKVILKADVSSQYISALLLIGATLENGLELLLEGEITSVPYIRMTLALLNNLGIETTFIENKITIAPATMEPSAKITVESDWSSASYFYSIVALSKTGTQITLSSYKMDSLQGDSILTEIYKNFGVATYFQDNTIVIVKTTENIAPALPALELNNAPDIAQTIAVTAFGLGLACHLTGLHTLKIKETDRLEALKTELTKLGATVFVTNDSLTLEASTAMHPNANIATYQDHRMAMAFAPLALRV
ncbi:MAG TPA: 3-phosphoshikimate 1-carboxyvinyltransferase, partial [Flavobacterium sp.]